MKTLGLVLALLVVGSGACVATSVTIDLYSPANSQLNYICAPLVPFNPNPMVVFAGADPEYNLYRWDAPTQNPFYFEQGGEFGNILLGDGYYLSNGGSAASISYDGVPDGVPDSGGIMTDMWISLPGKQTDAFVDPPDGGGKHLIGQPFDHDTPTNGPGATGDNIWFTDGTTLKTWEEAYNADWVQSAMEYWDAPTQNPMTMTYQGWGNDDTLRAKTAYWLFTKKDNIALIIPAYNPPP